MAELRTRTRHPGSAPQRGGLAARLRPDGAEAGQEDRVGAVGSFAVTMGT